MASSFFMSLGTRLRSASIWSCPAWFTTPTERIMQPKYFWIWGSLAKFPARTLAICSGFAPDDPVHFLLNSSNLAFWSGVRLAPWKIYTVLRGLFSMRFTCAAHAAAANATKHNLMLNMGETLSETSKFVSFYIWTRGNCYQYRVLIVVITRSRILIRRM
jgi:hypothetical protein